MSQVIIYTNTSGGVSVCKPTGELSIEDVLAKDCPENAIIIDESELPSDDFDAWVLNDGVVTVDATKKAKIQATEQEQVNAKASALSKLTALGLTQDEIKALVD
jgi:hypothetical protein